jgi:hypothetical protein
MLVAILFLLKTEEEKTKMRPPNVIFEVVLTWDAESGDDLDLYVQSASGHVVAFNNREGGHGSLISLDHDALDDAPVKATIKLIKIKPFKEEVTKEIVFESTGQEKTAFRFRTDKSATVVEINELPAKLVTINTQ